MNNIDRIKKKVKYKLDKDVIDEVFSFYGNDFNENKDDEIITFIDKYYTVEVKGSNSFKKQVTALCAFLLINLVLVVLLFLIFDNDKSVLTSPSLYLGIIINSILAYLIYLFFGYFIYSNQSKTINVKKLKQLMIKQNIIIFIFALVIGLLVYYASNDYYSAIFATVGILNAIWGTLIGVRFTEFK